MLSPEARVRLASIIRDRLRAERDRVRRGGVSEPPWMAELDALADDLLNVELNRKRALNGAAQRRSRERQRLQT
jgi:hypothetical protein